MTLACEDGAQVVAHKVVLVSCSPFFKDLVQRNKHPHPWIYIKGVRSEDLVAIRDFLYQGETSVCQENLNSFLALAEAFQLKDLQENDQLTEKNISKTFEPKHVSRKTNIAPEKLHFTEERPLNLHRKTISTQSLGNDTYHDTAIALNSDSFLTNETELAEKVKSMMSVSENRILDGRKAKICKVCGKEGQFQNITSRIEANHIRGIALPCDICGTITASRNGPAQHKLKFHKQ